MAQLQQLQIAFGSTEEKAVELSNARIGALIAAIGTKRTNSEIKVTQDKTTEASLLSGWVKAQDGQTVSESNAYVLKKSGVSVSGDLEAEEYSLLTDGTTTLYENKQMLISCVNADGVSVAMQSMVTWIFLDFNYRIRESALITDEDIRQQFNVKNWVDLGNNKYRGTLIDTTGVIKISPATKNYSWSIPVEVRAYPASIDDNSGMTDAIRENRLTESVSFNAQAISVNTATIVCNSNNIKVGDQLIFNVVLGPTNNTKLEANPTYTADITCQDLTDMGNYFIVPEGMTNFTMMANITYMGRQFAVTQSFAVEHTILSKTMNPTVWAAVYAGLKAADEANETARWTDLTEDSEFGTGDAMRVNEGEFLQIMTQLGALTSSVTFTEGQYFGGFDTLTINNNVPNFKKCTSVVLSNNLKNLIVNHGSSTGVLFGGAVSAIQSFVADGIELIQGNAGSIQCMSSCPNLKTISMNALKTIDCSKVSGVGNILFQRDKKLETISFPSLEEILTDGSLQMFQECTLLKSVSMPKLKNITCKHNYLFDGCSLLTTVNLPLLETMHMSSNNYMFQKCTSLTSIEFPSLTMINMGNLAINRMFGYCYALESFKAKKLSFIGNTSTYVGYNNMFEDCRALSYVEMGTDANELSMGKMYTANVGEGRGMFYNAGQNVENTEVYLNNLTDIEPGRLFENCLWLFSDTKVLDWSQTKLTSFVEARGYVSTRCSMLKNNKTICKVSLPSTFKTSYMENNLFDASKVVVLDIKNCTTLSTIKGLVEDIRNKMLFYHVTAGTPPTIAAFSAGNTMPIFIGQTSSSKTLVDNIMSRYFAATNWSSLYNQLGYNEMMADYNAWLADKSVECVWEKGGDTQYAGLTGGEAYFHREDGSYGKEGDRYCLVYEDLSTGNLYPILYESTSQGITYCMLAGGIVCDDIAMICCEEDPCRTFEVFPEFSDDNTTCYIKTKNNLWLYSQNLGLTGSSYKYSYSVSDDGELKYGGTRITLGDNTSNITKIYSAFVSTTSTTRYGRVLLKKMLIEASGIYKAILVSKKSNGGYVCLGTNSEGTEIASVPVTFTQDGKIVVPESANVFWSLKNYGTTSKFRKAYNEISNKTIDLGSSITTPSEVALVDYDNDDISAYGFDSYSSGGVFVKYDESTGKFMRLRSGDTGYDTCIPCCLLLVATSYDNPLTHPTTSQVHASNVNSNRIFPQYMKEFICKSVLGKTYETYCNDMAIKNNGYPDLKTLFTQNSMDTTGQIIATGIRVLLGKIQLKKGEGFHVKFADSSKIKAEYIYIFNGDELQSYTRIYPYVNEYSWKNESENELGVYLVVGKRTDNNSSWITSITVEEAKSNLEYLNYIGDAIQDYDYEDITPELLEDYGLTIEDE